jgi:hypothetical protein
LTPIAAGLQPAIASRHQSAARRRTRSAPKRGASCRTTTTRSRRGRPSEYAVNLGGHDEVVLMQSLDLLGLQRDRRIAPRRILFRRRRQSSDPRTSPCCRSNSSPPEAQRTCDSCHQGLPPKQSRPRCIYRAQVENSSDDYAVILPEVAVAFGDLHQI